jgi:hypothetical protein
MLLSRQGLVVIFSMTACGIRQWDQTGRNLPEKQAAGPHFSALR